MIRQVRLREMYKDTTGAVVERPTPVFAFGTHPQVTSEDEAHPVSSAKAIENKLRIIVDELLIGNNLEEIACRVPIDGDAYDAVPLGTTPDDVARCAVAADVLPSSCPAGPRALCICKLDGGCGEVPNGQPVGVLDVNQDGAADDTRFINGAVGLRCGTVDVPINLEASYWNPSGDQNVPAVGGFDALGPAVVLTPAVPTGAPAGVSAMLPTNTMCNLVFAPSVVDKQGNQVCAPADGNIDQDCTPGDVNAFTFTVEPLTVRVIAIQPDQMGVSRTNAINIKFNAPLDAASVAGIQLLEGTTPYTQGTPSMPSADTFRITPPAGGFPADTTFTISVPTSVSDYYAQPLPMPFTLSFTTGQ